MFKFYILLSNPSGFFRHFSPHYSGLTKDNAEIVINTQDRENERDIVHLCELFDVRYHITKSNGTPARGKNELLKIFLNSDNEYMVQIDGDDFLTPHGVWLYQHVANLKNPPDAICLKNQVALCIMGKMFSDDQKKGLKKFFTKPERNLDYETMEESLLKKHDVEYVEKVLNAHRSYYGEQQQYAEDDDAHCRVTFFSKKAAQYCFPENFVVGEDTLQYYDLKHAHIAGDLVVLCNDEAPATYVYNQLDGRSTVWRETKGFTNWSWMFKFNEEVQNRKELGLLHKEDLPLLKLNYADIKNAVFDDINTAGLVKYSRGEKQIDLPANASEKCVIQLLNRI